MKTSPAFPFEYHNQTGVSQNGFFDTGVLAPGASQQFCGMTMRDYFAAKAMQSYIANQRGSVVVPDDSKIAEWSYEMADAMLAEREEEPQ